jgi:hypothetical protein
MNSQAPKTLTDEVKRAVKKVPGKSRKRLQKLQRRFRNSVDEAELLMLADAIDNRMPGFKEDIGLEVAKRLV